MLAVLARLASPATADLSYLILAGYALLGRRQVIQALLLSWLFTMMNPGLAPDAAFGLVGRYLVLFLAFLSIVVRGGFRGQDRFFWYTVASGIFFITHAIVISPIPDVSILKALIWTLAMTTLLAAWSGLNELQRARIEKWLFGFLVVVAVVSLFFLVIPEIGYLRNGRGFQGILNHPQAFGLTMALLGAFALGRLLAHKRPPLPLLGMALGCLVLIVLSQARTAGIGLSLGVAVSVISILLSTRDTVRSSLPALRSKRFFVLALLLLVGFVITGSQLSNVVNDFVMKGEREGVDGVVTAYENSRAVLFLPMLDNIYSHPLAGIGFGIASDPFAMNISRDPLFGIAVGASIEKGSAPLAVLEELGIPGFIIIGLWIWLLLRRSAANGITFLLVAMTALVLNMGEAILFSPGGMGMLVLIVLAFSATKPRPSEFIRAKNRRVVVSA